MADSLQGHAWAGKPSARSNLAQRPVDPQRADLFLYAVLAQALAETVEVDAVELLVLVEAGEDHRFLAGHRIAMELQALRADLLHHALHGGVDRSQRAMLGLQVR